MVGSEFWALSLNVKNEKLGIRQRKTYAGKWKWWWYESYNENNGQQQLPEGFANRCYEIVAPILLQKIINDFAVCKHQKHCSGTLLLAEDVSHGFGI